MRKINPFIYRMAVRISPNSTDQSQTVGEEPTSHPQQQHPQQRLTSSLSESLSTECCLKNETQTLSNIQKYVRNQLWHSLNSSLRSWNLIFLLGGNVAKKLLLLLLRNLFWSQHFPPSYEKGRFFSWWRQLIIQESNIYMWMLIMAYSLGFVCFFF